MVPPFSFYFSSSPFQSLCAKNQQHQQSRIHAGAQAKERQKRGKVWCALQ
jgi:hypothetical protein